MLKETTINIAFYPLVLTTSMVALALYLVYLDGGYAKDQKQYP